MASIYADQHRSLKELLAMAGKLEDATLLIPDLQRPYIWEPTQVVVLVDSLIRGWPFGTLLTWKVKPDDPVRGLARPFLKIADRTEEGESELISARHPPAAFHMVLDGQQRVQSLLLAFGGDGWGFKILDRKWHEHLNGIKPRGPHGRLHWSLGCLCVDVDALTQAYNRTRRAAAIDYTTVLRWVITDDARGQSILRKPPTYKEPLARASSEPTRFIRLSRLWEAAPEQAGIDSYEAEDRAANLMQEYGATGATRDRQKRPLGALLMALRDVKQTRVTYLELAEYDETLGSKDFYNDAVVNVFTRLNTAGRTLTREDITFAWLKVGWTAQLTEHRSAKKCIEELTQELKELSISISVEDVVSAISFVWSVSFNSGRLLDNNDLMRGEAIRPMAANISENWQLVTESARRVSSQVWERGLRFREHYFSVNALAYLWAWYFSALYWGRARGLNVLEDDRLEKNVSAALDLFLDRWIICTQWAGVWSSASAQSIAGYAARLATCVQDIANEADIARCVAFLKHRLEMELSEVEQAAVSGLFSINADDREQVRGYYTPLWIWNRLDPNRWEKAKVALRQRGRRQPTLEVDHIVAFHLWNIKVSKLNANEPSDNRMDDNLADLNAVNDLGNSMLLEKNFNISKSVKPLNKFLEDVHEFRVGALTVEDWAKALNIKMPQVDSANTEPQELARLFSERAQSIRGELEQFIRGTKARVDLQ